MSSRRPRIRVSVVIGLLCAVIVLVVAAASLAITYSVSLRSVRDIGRRHAAALASAASFQAAAYFDMPAAQLDAVADLMKRPGYMLPGDEPDQQNDRAHEKFWNILFMVGRMVNFSYSAEAFIFEDASSTIMFGTRDGRVAYGYSRFRGAWPQGDMVLRAYAVSTATGQSIANATPYTGDLAVSSDGRFAAYSTAKLIASSAPEQGLWYPVSVVVSQGWVRFALPAAHQLFNATGHFLGIVTVTQPLDAVGVFLRSVRGTPGTEAFAVQGDGRLIGSTHATPHYVVTEVADRSVPPGRGCASSADTTTSTTDPVYHACRTAAADFAAYPPLQAAARQAGFLQASTTDVRVIAVNRDGPRYFVVSVPVPNNYRLWGLNVILCMPESDVLGDIVKGRNTAIGVTAGVFVAASLLSFALVHALLHPLSIVSQKMLDTARLRETEDERNYSVLSEIHDLQKAYTNMNTAIKSFTRYVPRDVVKDLMASGQLCTIQMESKMCTMLFVDIAGFTTICERVPPDQLSELVSQYFDRASRIVMDHDGLIDKFIGDCIMAVWGAPFAVAHQEVKAVLTGVLINRETCVEPLSKSWDEAGEQLRVRVGISTGEVLAGNMGSADRMNYTVIGDPVNLAARLESMNKQFDTRVMVSEMTAEGLGGAFVLRLLMPIAVVGKDKPVKVYEVVGLPTQMDTVFDLRASDEANTPAGSMESADVFALSLPDSPLGLTATPTGFDSRRRSAYAGSRRGHRNAVELLQHARTVSVAGPPEGRLVLTAAEVESAALHSAAVTAFLAKMFDECLVLLERSTGGASGNGGVFPQHEKSVSLRSGDDSYVSHGGLSLADMSAPFASIRTPTSTSPARHAFSVTTLAPTNDPSLEPLAAADTFASHAGPFAIEDIEDDEAGQRTVSMRGPSPRGDGAEFTGRGTAVRRLSIASFNPGSTAARLLRRECLRCAASCPDDFTGVFRALEK